MASTFFESITFLFFTTFCRASIFWKCACLSGVNKSGCDNDHQQPYRGKQEKKEERDGKSGCFLSLLFYAFCFFLDSIQLFAMQTASFVRRAWRVFFASFFSGLPHRSHFLLSLAFCSCPSVCNDRFGARKREEKEKKRGEKRKRNTKQMPLPNKLFAVEPPLLLSSPCLSSSLGFLV